MFLTVFSEKAKQIMEFPAEYSNSCLLFAQKNLEQYILLAESSLWWL